ncbi:MAG: peptidoglycan-binding protein, partial [Patescibacteria group bacterium]
NPPSGGGGGGGGIFTQKIVITNEKITKINNTTALISWTTNLPATSRVAYGVYSLSNEKLDTSKNDYGYGNTNVEYTALTYAHSMLITNLTPDVIYYFRPNSYNSNSPRVIGIELNLSMSQILGQCNYLLEFLKLGANNNIQEVIKLQTFLRNFEGFKNQKITGIFDEETYNAVLEFQNKYKANILSPWSHNEPTGFVYITTKKKINEIYCQREFPLSVAEKTEIERFKTQTGTIIEEIKREGGDVRDIIGKTNEATGTAVAFIETEKATTTTSIIASGANALVAAVVEIPNQVITSLEYTVKEIAKGVYKGILGFSRLFLK